MKVYYKIGIFVILYSLGLAQLANAQEPLKYTNLSVHFIIKDHWVITQKYADSIAKRESEFFDRLIKSDAKTIPPQPPSVAVFNRRQTTHLLIKPEHFIFYSIRNEFAKDSTIITDVSDIYKIDRINKKMSRFYPDSFEFYTDEKDFGAGYFGYKDDNRFQLIEENKNKRREICGFDCYQVIVRDTNTNRPVEMYVTEEIILEYHPVFNVKKYLARYYPLYLRFYDPEFPNDYYRE
ncbi:MAG: hypothetical protein KJO53_01685, partial [Eudoraea sp.]|nr:hypothetical protein [Eudoraea sp.]